MVQIIILEANYISIKSKSGNLNPQQKFKNVEIRSFISQLCVYFLYLYYCIYDTLQM